MHVLFSLLFAAAAQAQSFGLEDVARRAQQLAAAPYQPSDVALPPALRELTREQYRQIRYKPERALWRDEGLPFELQFFHPGDVFTAPVRINVFGSQGIRALPFQPANFDYGNLEALAPEALKDLFYSGFRVHYAINSQSSKDEVLVFQGASFFRALGRQQRYGISARGLAVDTALMSGEEFPQFTEFWIGWPSPGDEYLVIYALLDSRRVTGAYRFELRPGTTTRIDVRSRLFLRDGVAKLGVAPLTSMFLYGENQPAGNDDYRPEVHDSDGLSALTGAGEWLWRPLVNPRRLLVTSLAMNDPRGFGLMQRDRQFSSYEDLSARFDLRPSVWVTPRGNWGSGRVELVQIPTPDDTNDNIVAYWVRDAAPLPGQPLDLAYTLHWQMQETTLPPTSHVTQTLSGRGSDQDGKGTLRMVVDFEGPALQALPADATLFASLSLSDNGELLERRVVRNDVSGGWRLLFRFRRIDEQKPVELRAALRHQDKVVSETWSYILPPF